MRISIYSVRSRDTMQRMIFVFAILLATLFGQQLPAPLGGKKTAPPKEKKERKHQVYRNFRGTDTFVVQYCMPGRVEEGMKGQIYGVPCGCFGMYQQYWEKEAGDCNRHKRGTNEWMDCHKSIKGCSEFLAHGGDSALFGENDRAKCQVYCYERQSCRCCDDNVAWQRMDKWHKGALAAMVALKRDVRLLGRHEACNEIFALSYDPVRPQDLFYAAASSLLR